LNKRRGFAVTRGSFTHPREPTSLKRLNFEETQVTDADLEHLRGLNHLEHPALYATEVTNTTVDHLIRLTAPKTRELVQSQVGGVRAKQLANRRMLDLFGTEVADEVGLGAI
jgi:hypothetical protein